jgi:leader peptidase (prepilin peptidase)/N-methyltransferase
MAMESAWMANLLFILGGLLSGSISAGILQRFLSRQEESITGCFSAEGKKPYPAYLLPLLTAGLFVLLFQIYGLTVETGAYCFMVTILLLLAFIDFKTMLIPYWSIIALFPAGLLLAFFSQDVSWPARIIGFVSAGIFLLLIVILSQGGMGIGDVKLMAVIGFCLGWKATFLALFLASLIGGTVGLGILAGGKGNLKTEIPFGPFLVTGIIISILYGQELLAWYLNLF